MQTMYCELESQIVKLSRALLVGCSLMLCCWIGVIAASDLNFVFWMMCSYCLLSLYTLATLSISIVLIVRIMKKLVKNGDLKAKKRVGIFCAGISITSLSFLSLWLSYVVYYSSESRVVALFVACVAMIWANVTYARMVKRQNSAKTE